MTTNITIQSEGRRHYLIGNTYPIKDRLRAAGAKWDADRRAWWTGKRELAEQLAGAAPAGEEGSSPSSERPSREAPGESATVAARANYKGKTYYVAGRVDRGRTHWDDRVEAVTSRDGSRILLYFRDGSSQFWASRSAVQVVKCYTRPTTIARLREYAEEAKRAEAEGRDLEQERREEQARRRGWDGNRSSSSYYTSGLYDEES